MKTYQKLMDKVAVGLSFACAAHCLLLPFLLIILPAIGSLPLADEEFHKVLLFAVLPLSALTLLVSCRRHKQWQVLEYGFLGLGILTATAFWGHELLGEMGERVATLVGALVIAYAHFRNYRACEVCDEERCEVPISAS